MDQLKIYQRILFFILVTGLLDIVLMLLGEILSWSLMGVKGLIVVIWKSVCYDYKYRFHFFSVSDCEIQSMVHVYQNLAALSPRDKQIDKKTL